MYLARRFRKILIHTIPDQTDKLSDINTFTQDQLKIYVKNESKLVKDFNEDLGSKTWSKCGTLNYMAPELLSNKTYDEKCDLWSFLCVILEINLTQPMFNPIAMSTRELKNKAEFSDTELNIITLLHKITPSERATADEINRYILDRPVSPILDPPSSIIRKRSASLDET